MEIHQLRYFVAIYETGSFGRAADRCSVAQPSLSQQIIKLEKELGHDLFDRLGRSIAVTDAGRALYPRAKRIVLEVDDARDAVAEELDLGGGHVRVGAIPTMAPYLLPSALREFRRKYPDASIELFENVTDELTRMLIDAQIDIAIMSGPNDDPRLGEQTLVMESMCLALPATHRLAKRKRLKLADLDGEPSIVLHEMHCLSMQVASFCAARHLSSNIVCRTAQLTTVLRLIARGVGYSIVPKSCVTAEKHRGLVYREITGASPKRPVVAVWNASRRRPALGQQFAELVGDTCAGIDGLERVKR